MKHLFRWALLLNGIAWILLFSLLRERRNVNATVEPAVNPPRASAAPAGSFSAPAATADDNRTFHWSEIESSDYLIYVKNLRQIGCPEQTIRDIIQADVASLFAAKRQELPSVESETGPWSRSQEGWLIATLLGDPLLASAGAASTGTAGMQPPAVAETVAETTTAPPPSLPLVLQEFDWASLGLEADQAEAIEQLREEFVARIGGRDQDPHDPAYLQRWTEAQPEMDQAVPGLVGRDVYLQMDAGRAADEIR